MKNLSLFCLLIIGCIANAQNLVPNPGFEEYLQCPEFIGDLTVTSWINPTNASPDYFNSCNTENLGVPQNAFGWQNAQSGNGFVGCHMSNFGQNEYREYIQCQLNEELQEGEQYIVSFYVSRADSCTLACDNIGALLTQEQISSTDNLNLEYSPQVVSPPNEPIQDDLNWVLISDTIAALGGEQFLTIGVFSENANTNWIEVEGGWQGVPHYYFDDVSVTKIIDKSMPEITSISFNVHPNPALDKITVNSNSILNWVSISDLQGKVMLIDNKNSSSIILDISNLPSGFYILSAGNQNSKNSISLIKK